MPRTYALATQTCSIWEQVSIVLGFDSLIAHLKYEVLVLISDLPELVWLMGVIVMSNQFGDNEQVADEGLLESAKAASMMLDGGVDPRLVGEFMATYLKGALTLKAQSRGGEVQEVPVGSERRG